MRGHGQRFQDWAEKSTVGLLISLLLRPMPCNVSVQILVVDLWPARTLKGPVVPVTSPPNLHMPHYGEPATNQKGYYWEHKFLRSLFAHAVDMSRCFCPRWLLSGGFVTICEPVTVLEYMFAWRCIPRKISAIPWRVADEMTRFTRECQGRFVPSWRGFKSMPMWVSYLVSLQVVAVVVD